MTGGDDKRMRVLVHDSYPVHPWRNGKGILRNVAEGEGWQLRLADIAQSGAFSDFSGFLRHFAIVQGSVILRMPSGAEVACNPRSPVAVFDGGAAPECDLVEGPARAFNLISDPVKVQGGLERHLIGDALLRVPDGCGALVAIHVQAGEVECLPGQDDDEGMTQSAGSTCRAGVHDTVVCLPAGGVRLQASATSGETVVLVVRVALREDADDTDAAVTPMSAITAITLPGTTTQE